MSAQPSLKVIKSMPYRGGTRLWSNRYHFTGSDPTGSTQWQTLADAVTADEKIIYNSNVTIVEAVGYNGGSDVPVWTGTYSVAGTLGVTPYAPCPGEVALLIRYSTDQRTSKNHPLYLFNYFHGAVIANGATPDVPNSFQKAHTEDVAADWIAGYSDGTNTRKRCGPNGAVAIGYLAETYLTHRDFPR